MHMSGIRHCVSESPAGPFEPHLTSPNRVLVGEACEALPPTPFGLSCGAILLRDLSPSAARALTSHALWARVPSRVASQGHFEYTRKGGEEKALSVFSFLVLISQKNLSNVWCPVSGRWGFKI